MSTIRKTAGAAVIGITSIAAIGLSSAAATATSTAPTDFHHSDSSRADGANSGGVVFVQDDNISGNRVHVYERTSDGGLTAVGSYATGGNGGVLGGADGDNLASQGSLIYDRAAGLLYVVNAGSNTVTVFSVQGDTLVRRQVVSSGGDFPVSIAVHDHRVFVLNARDGGSVAGFLQVAGHLVPVPSWHRTLGLDTNQTPEFPATAAEVKFSPDGSNLVVTTKNGGNSVDVFSVGLLGPAAEPTVTSLPGTLPFGFDFDPAGHLVLTEVGTDTVATFDIASDGQLTPLDSVATGQAASCWIVDVDGIEYVSNTRSGTVSIYKVDSDGVLTDIGLQTAHAGTVDLAASSDGRFLYVQGGAAGVIDSYRIGADGTLTSTGTVTVPNAVGAEGIAAS
jgi:6-phosphogluconolactonase (cycloisomerase 2 family)